MKTVKAALTEAACLLKETSDTPILDAEVLLLDVLDKDRAYLRAWPDKELSEGQLSAYRTLVSQRQSGQPVAYLTGIREFWSLDFMVTSDVLIPRPETELLIELSLAIIPAGQAFKIIDLGTGSGNIAVTLGKERPNAEITATDISPAALQVAINNARSLGVDNIQFYLGHWFENIADGKFNLIVSNPPYIAENDGHLQIGDLRFEPKIALAAGQQGLSDIRTIAETAIDRLEPEGYLIIEHGYNQKEEVNNLFHSLGYRNIQSHTDLSGQPRVTLGQYLP